MHIAAAAEYPPLLFGEPVHQGGGGKRLRAGPHQARGHDMQVMRIAPRMAVYQRLPHIHLINRIPHIRQGQGGKLSCLFVCQCDLLMVLFR